MGSMDSTCACPLCGAEVRYREASEKTECHYCKVIGDSSLRCLNGHSICDKCRNTLAYDMIERHCLDSRSDDPMETALSLMRSPYIRIHGPVHHFLVPAVLLSAYYSIVGNPEEKERKVKEARKRAVNVLGGFCGLYGDCGAAVGTGIFISLITDATPLSKYEWRLCNLMTSKSLLSIASYGGPRCCKRDSFLSIIEAVGFVKEHFGVTINAGQGINCGFSPMNKECIKAECPFYPG